MMSGNWFSVENKAPPVVSDTIGFEPIAQQLSPNAAPRPLVRKIMAIIQNDLIVKGLSGKVGKQLAVHRTSDGQYRICPAEFDNHQLTHVDLNDEQPRGLYDALFSTKAGNQQNPVARSGDGVIVSGIIHPPEIHRIDISHYTGKSGESIVITAGDDVNVPSVGILIVSDDGVVIERGSAILSDRNPYCWAYATKTTSASRSVKIIVNVADVVPIGGE